MPDYVEVFKAGDDVTFTAGAAITGGQLLAVTGVNIVAPTSGATDAWIAVAVQDAVTGSLVGTTAGGVQELTCATGVTAGQTVVPAAGGAVAPLGAGTNYAQVVGLALTTAVAGAKARVKLAR